MPRWIGFAKGLIALACGGVAVAGFAPFGWYALALVALAVLAALLIDAPPRQALFYGWLFGLELLLLCCTLTECLF